MSYKDSKNQTHEKNHISFIFNYILSFSSVVRQVKSNDIPIKDGKNYTLETVASDIAIPWYDLLPDGSMLVTEKWYLYHVKTGKKPK
jgi:hypothetical protein